MRTRLARCALFALSTGCAASGYRGLEPGAALSVEPVITQVPNAVTSEIRDSAGVTVGTSSTVIGYRAAVTDYRLKQGNRAIDEQDYFHLAGDADGASRIAAERTRLQRNNRIGRIILAASAVGAVAFPATIGGRGGLALGMGSILLVAPIGGVIAAINHDKVNRKKLGARRAYAAIGQAPPGWAR